MLVPCIVESAVYRAINKLGFSSVKYQQIMVINEFIRNRDVFCSSTYRLCKNIVFYLPSNGLRPDSQSSVVLVVISLIAIMKAHV